MASRRLRGVRSSAMAIRVYESETVIVLELDDGSECGDFRQALADHLEDFCLRAASKPDGAVISLRRVNVLASHLLALLLMLGEIARRRGFSVRLASVRPDLRHLIELLKLPFDIRSDDDDPGDLVLGVPRRR
jgi:anti-anti-sigma regulatory factor